MVVEDLLNLSVVLFKTFYFKVMILSVFDVSAEKRKKIIFKFNGF